jgi:pimeloyl-ACP methyl ester carboxylesterase
MTKIPVYLMPGLAASSTIFEKIKLPENQFEIYYLNWQMPELDESLDDYAKRMATFVKHENIILIGVSFGGILVQEMKKYLNTNKVIIISSVKSNLELPQKMKLAKATKAYKLLPTGMVANLDSLTKYAFGTMIKERLNLYKKYLTMKDKVYLDWAIKNVICWERTEIDQEIIHIHGDDDSVFPVNYIGSFINVKRGTHIMILNRYKWFNENLPKIILQ